MADSVGRRFVRSDNLSDPGATSGSLEQMGHGWDD